jgi:hypothetical protein
MQYPRERLRMVYFAACLAALFVVVPIFIKAGFFG